MCTQRFVHKYSSHFYLQEPKTERAKCPSKGEWINKLKYIHTMK